MADKPTREELEAFWADKAHWSGSMYFCKKDPRLLVPKRIRWMGWTINFGHRFGSLIFLILIFGLFAAGFLAGSSVVAG